MKRLYNKTLLAQATPAGTAYYVVRPKAGRYVSVLASSFFGDGE